MDQDRPWDNVTLYQILQLLRLCCRIGHSSDEHERVISFSARARSMLSVVHFLLEAENKRDSHVCTYLVRRSKNGMRGSRGEVAEK